MELPDLKHHDACVTSLQPRGPYDVTAMRDMRWYPFVTSVNDEVCHRCWLVCFCPSACLFVSHIIKSVLEVHICEKHYWNRLWLICHHRFQKLQGIVQRFNSESCFFVLGGLDQAVSSLARRFHAPQTSGCFRSHGVCNWLCLEGCLFQQSKVWRYF